MGAGSGRRYRVLVVEDNPGDVQLLRMALEHADLDCELTLIADGGEALAFIRQGSQDGCAPLDLVILDLNVPKSDGLEILEAMRTSGDFERVPVAMLSSSSSPREQERMEVFRVARRITKPPDLEEYLKIGTILRELLQERYDERPGAASA